MIVNYTVGWYMCYVTMDSIRDTRTLIHHSPLTLWPDNTNNRPDVLRKS